MNNKTLQEFTEQELMQALANNTIQREILSTNINLLAQEVLRRNQQSQPKPDPINLPELKRINPMPSGSVTE